MTLTTVTILFQWTPAWRYMFWIGVDSSTFFYHHQPRRIDHYAIS